MILLIILINSKKKIIRLLKMLLCPKKNQCCYQEHNNNDNDNDKPENYLKKPEQELFDDEIDPYEYDHFNSFEKRIEMIYDIDL